MASARSCPAQNAFPDPVISTARMDGSAHLSSACCKANAISRLKALYLSGRFKVRITSEPRISVRMVDMVFSLYECRQMVGLMTFEKIKGLLAVAALIKGFTGR